MAVIHIERWGPASEIREEHHNGHTIVSSLIEFELSCAKCWERFEAGQWSRSRFGPHGATHYHDDCTPAREGDEEEVVCPVRNCQIRAS